MKKIIRKWLLDYCFTEHEKISMINALYRRSKDNDTNFISGENEIKYTCKSLANEFMNCKL